MIRVDGKRSIWAEVVADSISEFGQRLITFRLHYPRLIHAEVMTHRSFSRNASSSRAIPVSKMLEQVQNNPAMPVHFGKNKSGMQDDGVFDQPIEVPYVDYKGNDQILFYTPEEFWTLSGDAARMYAEKFSETGYHKQVANRLLEPYQYMNTIISMTDIDNFFHLRLHKDADPTFINLTECMYEAYNQSEPMLVKDGDYHLPFIKKVIFNNNKIRYFVDEIEVPLSTAIKVSTSVCAQVSYRKNDLSVEKAMKIWDMLVTMNPIHGSALEHVAKPFTYREFGIRSNININIKANGLIGIDAMYCANFKGWISNRKMIKGENVTHFTGEWN